MAKLVLPNLAILWYDTAFSPYPKHQIYAEPQYILRISSIDVFAVPSPSGSKCIYTIICSAQAMFFALRHCAQITIPAMLLRCDNEFAIISHERCQYSNPYRKVNTTFQDF